MDSEELNTLITTINDGFNSLVKTTLVPYVRNMEDNREQFLIISNVLKQLPEYQNMLATNAELRLEIANLKQQLNPDLKVSLKVTETKNEVIDQTKHVALIYENVRITQNNNTCSHMIDTDESDNDDELDDESYDEEYLNKFSNHSKIDESKIRKIEINDTEDNRCAHVLDDDETDWRLTADQQADEEADDEEEDDKEYEESEDEGQQAAGERETWSDSDLTLGGDSGLCAADYDKSSIEAEDDEEEEAAEEEEEADEEEEEDAKEEDAEEDEEEEEEEVEVNDLVSSDEAEDEEEEEEEIFIIELEGADDKEYYTNDDENGDIYKILTDGNPGEKLGRFINGEPLFI